VLVLLQAVAFAGCVLFDLLPSTEVECRFGVPVVGWSAPPPAGEDAPGLCPAAPEVVPTDQCRET
jgi:hypothetical protein